ncbi:MAG: hypothetical protein ONB25_14190 [candidate division KSB1 bacterium]|nr:hypothetical protein [candidate division KSB1 bacterium]MDZ7412161.1 hypothetical protein [candidate division KSB1 bacterium]
MDMRAGFPIDDYTPFGYLDNPGHTWKLSRAGLIRLPGPLSVAWHFPNVPNCSAALLLQLGVQVGQTTAIGGVAPDALPGKVACPYHSKNLVLHRLVLNEIEFTVEFAVVSADVLTCLCRVRNRAEGPLPATVLVLASGVSLPDAGGLWQFGTAEPLIGPEGALVVRSFAEGPAFAVQLVPKSSAVEYLCPEDRRTEETLVMWRHLFPSAKDIDTVVRAAVMHVPVLVPAGAQKAVEIRVARGWSEGQLTGTLKQAARSMRYVLAKRRDEDAAFWQGCPELLGDWPGHWRHGWVYDWETLRMCVRRPVGVFRTEWDGMQVQKPRVVLAEAALDSLLLSYAEPERAAEVVHGTFVDALADNVPCAREDGSTNMVAADGSECGTSPAWCFPFYCLEVMFWRSGDRSWMRKLLPHMERYLRWWLRHRCDEQGWAFYKCSWESGQDCSEKFGIAQPTGGEIVEHLRPVDLQVGLYSALSTVGRLRRALGLTGGRWQAQQKGFAERIQQMWHHDWFCDFDRRFESWVRPDGYWDITNLAPLLCGLATQEQVNALLPKIHWFLENPRYWLEWPSFFFMFAEILWQIDQLRALSGLIWDTAERIYSHSDSRSWDGQSPIPGVAAECWGLEGPKGTEGYGWGATLPLHIIRGMLGCRELLGQQQTLVLSPALPEVLVGAAGVRVGVSKMGFRRHRFSLVYESRADGRLGATLVFAASRSPVRAVRAADGTEVQFTVHKSKEGCEVTFELENFCKYEVELRAR